MSKSPFVIITLPRSGSYHLRALLDSAPDIRCYGEIFKGSEVELPPEELAFVELSKKDTEKRDQMGMALLNRLRKKTDAEGVIFGFKDFRFNLTRVKIYQQMLNSKGWRKVFLFRNPIERYISMERADLTGVFVVTEKNKDAGLAEALLARNDEHHGFQPQPPATEQQVANGMCRVVEMLDDMRADEMAVGATAAVKQRAEREVVHQGVILQYVKVKPLQMLKQGVIEFESHRAWWQTL
jgi:hypothetical protein